MELHLPTKKLIAIRLFFKSKVGAMIVIRTMLNNRCLKFQNFSMNNYVCNKKKSFLQEQSSFDTMLEIEISSMRK